MNYRVILCNRARDREWIEYWFCMYEPTRDRAYMNQYKNHLTIIRSEYTLSVF